MTIGVSVLDTGMTSVSGQGGQIIYIGMPQTSRQAALRSQQLA